MSTSPDRPCGSSRDLNHLIATMAAQGYTPERIAKALPDDIGDDLLVDVIRAHQAGIFRARAVSV